MQYCAIVTETDAWGIPQGNLKKSHDNNENNKETKAQAEDMAWLLAFNLFFSDFSDKPEANDRICTVDTNPWCQHSFTI